MEKTITIEKGSDTSRLSVIVSLLKHLPEDFFEEVDRNDGLSKFFGANTVVAKESFEATLIMKKL